MPGTTIVSLSLCLWRIPSEWVLGTVELPVWGHKALALGGNATRDTRPLCYAVATALSTSHTGSDSCYRELTMATQASVPYSSLLSHSVILKFSSYILHIYLHVYSQVFYLFFHYIF